MDDLLKALDNEENDTIMNLTHSKIKQQKNDILQRLQLKGNELKKYHKKLKNYVFCENPDKIRFGFYIRWIPLLDPDNIYLTNGGIVCDMKVVDGSLHIICKNNYNHLMQLIFNECLIFQKLSNQEHIILDILNYLDK